MENKRDIIDTFIAEGVIDPKDQDRYPRKKKRKRGEDDRGYYPTYRQIYLRVQRMYPTKVNEEDLKKKERTLFGNGGKKHLCVYCQKRKAKELDHWHCVNDYGADNALNKIPCCVQCNREKGSMSPDNYISAIRKRNNIEDRKIADRLRRFETMFGSTGKLDCIPEARKKLEWLRPKVRDMFRQLNALMDNEFRA